MMKNDSRSLETESSFADGLMRMSQKGAFKVMRLSRRRATVLLDALKEVIYYFPDCHCAENKAREDCACHDHYFAGIYWLKNRIFRIYPDLSEYDNPSAALFPKETLEKLDGIYLKEALKTADDLFGDEQLTSDALDWAFNEIHKIYSVFDLHSNS